MPGSGLFVEYKPSWHLDCKILKLCIFLMSQHHYEQAMSTPPKWPAQVWLQPKFPPFPLLCQWPGDIQTQLMKSTHALLVYSTLNPHSSHKDRWGSSHVVPCGLLHLPLPWSVKKINPLIAYALPSVFSAAVFVRSLKMAQMDLLPHLYYSTIRKTLLTYFSQPRYI